ncbi:MAG: c-type cytochrome [Gemmatimonadota bacterium]|nr:c-type cytochrome [Gemmatimonadota bacterium]
MRLLSLSSLIWLAIAAPLAGQADSASDPVLAGAELAAVERLFVSQCARCHGMGGTGGIAPSFRQPKLRRAPTDDAMVRVILSGIPGTAMAGFWNLSEDEARQLTAYVRSLGRLPPERVPGDSGRGRALYAGPGNCSTCHILAGDGAGWAPDLTDVGRRLNAAFLRRALIEPGADQPVLPLPSVHGPYPAYLVIEVTTGSGKTLSGTRVSEDDFTLVLRAVDGRLHSLEKTSLKALRKLPGQSPMPSYATAFSAEQLDDLVAYLASLKGEQ